MTFNLTIEPVDTNRPVALPAPWQDLEALGFCEGGEHEDIWLRAKGFALKCEREGCSDVGSAWLETAGRGFLQPFVKSEIAIDADDPHADIKHRALNALDELSNEFGRRVPSTVWNTLAFLSTRPDPTTEQTIIGAKEGLRDPYWVADTVLHALPIVYGLNFHVNSKFFEHTGAVLEHNCDCASSINVPAEARAMHCPLPKERWKFATAARFSHLCGQFILIVKFKMPFEMGLSPEAAEVMALQAAA